MARSKGWTCRRVTGGVICTHRNPSRKQLCESCGKRKPRRKSVAHLAVLATLTYEDFARINGGERCGICGATQKADGKRLHRDHDHRAPYAARGLLCFPCNSALRPYMTLEWLRAAVAYVERTHDGD